MIPKKIITEFKLKNKYECSNCKICTWLGDIITLEIDHIDGDNTNNNTDNLRYLCPNCHSQTPTWRGRNKNTGNQIVTDEQLLKSIEESKNIRQALIKVGLTPKGSNYDRVSKILAVKNIDFNNSQYGTIWINNGVSNKKIKKDELEDYMDNGYIKGRINCNPPIDKDSTQPIIKGRIWVTNGICNKMVFPNQIPTGFWKGKIQKKNT